MLPRIFIGSSTEGLPVARTVFSRVQKETVPTLWDQNVFLPGDYIFEGTRAGITEDRFRHSGRIG